MRNVNLCGEGFKMSEKVGFILTMRNVNNLTLINGDYKAYSFILTMRNVNQFCSIPRCSVGVVLY